MFYPILSSKSTKRAPVGQTNMTGCRSPQKANSTNRRKTPSSLRNFSWPRSMTHTQLQDPFEESFWGSFKSKWEACVACQHMCLHFPLLGPMIGPPGTDAKCLTKTLAHSGGGSQVSNRMISAANICLMRNAPQSKSSKTLAQLRDLSFALNCYCVRSSRSTSG